MRTAIFNSNPKLKIKMSYQSFPAYELFGEAFPSEDSGNVSLLLDHGCGSARDFHPTSIEVLRNYSCFLLV